MTVIGSGRPERYQLDDGTKPLSASEVAGYPGTDGLLRWALDLQRRGISPWTERDRLAAIGTATHAAIAATLGGDALASWLCDEAPEPAAAAAALAAWQGWWSGMQAEGWRAEHVECPIVSERLCLAGTPDCVIVRGEERRCVDWKSARHLRESGTAKPTMLRTIHLLQCGLYCALLADAGQPCASLAVVYLPTDGARACDVTLTGAAFERACKVALAHLEVVRWSADAEKTLGHWARPCLALEDVDAPEISELFAVDVSNEG
jgi:hypothetical protein